MNRLRTQLIVVFLAATLAPVAMTLWVTTSLLDESLNIAASREREIDALSRSLEVTGRAFYQRACALLKAQAAAGQVAPERFLQRDAARWPDGVAAFWESGDEESFVLAGDQGNRLDLLVRRDGAVWRYSSPLGDIAMQRLRDQFQQARASAETGRSTYRRRGFQFTYVILALSLWLLSFGLLVFLAGRITQPIRQLTAGLSQLAEGDLSARVSQERDDEVGRAIAAFNRMAAQLQESRDRLVYLAQLASWQTLARKMAHEVKNSLTPIRLTVEEMVARHGEGDPAFLEQASQIIVEEIESLERRIRAFSQFAAEPPVRPVALAVNAVVEERVAFLRTGHPEVSYETRFAASAPRAWADEDLVKGILTNLLENAADAAGPGGRILARTGLDGRRVEIEVHDSGPGLDDLVKQSLFQPTISFKKDGMGLGLSIARKSALLLGGDIVPVAGELGGAAFRVVLPTAPAVPNS